MMAKLLMMHFLMFHLRSEELLLQHLKDWLHPTMNILKNYY